MGYEALIAVLLAVIVWVMVEAGIILVTPPNEEKLSKGKRAMSQLFHLVLLVLLALALVYGSQYHFLKQ